MYVDFKTAMFHRCSVKALIEDVQQALSVESTMQVCISGRVWITERVKELREKSAAESAANTAEYRTKYTASIQAGHEEIEANYRAKLAALKEAHEKVMDQIQSPQSSANTHVQTTQ